MTQRLVQSEGKKNHMFAMNRHRSEDGFSTLSTLIGSVLGAMVIGGFMLFWFTADDGAQTSAERSRQETAANTVLNRAGRDISESRVVVKSAPRDFIVEKVTATPTTSNPSAQTVTRTRYAVIDRDGEQVLVRQVKTLVPTSSAPVVPAYNPTTPWTGYTEQVLGRNVDETKTKFDYRSATGATTSSPNDVGRVDITYVADTKGGQVELKSSASINEAIGGDGQRGGDDGSLDADEDQITIIAGQTGVVDVLENDSWTGTPSVAIVPGHGLNGSVGVNPTTGAVTITPSAAITTPTVYTITYRLSDGSGQSVTSTIRVSVQVPLDQPTIGWDDICTTDGADTYTLPTRTGIIYLVSRNGGAYTVTPAGTHNVTGEGTRISVGLKAVTDNPAPGYVIRDGSNFVLDVAETDAYTFDEMTCSVQPFVSNGVDSQADTSGTNRIAFSGGFLHYQRVSGNDSNPASGVVPEASGMIRGTVNHPVGLGTRYTYTLVKTRNRVEDTQATRPNGLRTAVQNDQYPLVPAVTTETGDNRDGTNTVSGLGTGGIVNRVDLRILQSYDAGGVVALRERSTVQSVPATYNDSGVARGTETVYFGVARSSCRTAAGAALNDCFSWGGGPTAGDLVGRANVYNGNGVARAYQAPAVRPGGVTGGTTNAKDCFTADGTRTVNPAIAANAGNRAYHCSSGASGISWTVSNGDHNMPSDSLFCSYTNACYVQSQRPGGTYQSATSPMSIQQSGWGVRDDYSVRSCNPGGCAEGGADIQMFSFAGPTEVNKVNQPEEKRHLALTAWYGGSCWTGPCNFSSNSEARAAWTNSSGAVNYRFTTGQVGSAPDVDTSTGTDSFYGFYSVVPIRTYYVRAIALPDNGDFWRRTATAVKGDATFFASPPHVSYLQDSPFCRPGDDDAWTYGFMYKKQAINPSGADVTDAVPLQSRHMWWLSKMAASSGDNIGVTAAPYWRVSPPDFGPDPTAHNPADWTTSTVFWGFSANEDMDGTWNKQRVGYRIPPLGGGGNGGVAHLRIEVFVTKANAGNPDFGDLRYWNGNSPDGETVDQMAGADLRVRAENVTKTEVENCAGNGTAGNAFTTGANWSAMADGAKVTRRYSPVGTVGNRQAPSVLRWNDVS